MKKRKSQKGTRFKATRFSRSSNQRIIEIDPTEAAIYVRRAEEHVIPLIEAHKFPPADAFFLLAQHARKLITGDAYPSVKSVVTMAEDIKALWQAGFYTPSFAYPYSFEATLEDEKRRLETKKDYSEYFQPFSSTGNHAQHGTAELEGGIMMHPETHLWQIWIIVGGPCIFLGAYHDPSTAQYHLGLILDATSKGGTKLDAEKLYEKLAASGDDVPKQVPFDMMRYLMEHLHLFKIRF